MSAIITAILSELFSTDQSPSS